MSSTLLKRLYLRWTLFAAPSLALLVASCAPPVASSDRVPASISGVEIDAVHLASDGMAYFNQGRLVDAALLLHQALFLKPGTRNLEITLAAAYEKLGMVDEARRRYESLLALAPNDGRLLAGLARTSARAGDFPLAYQQHEASLWAYVDKGDLGAAAAQAQSLSALAFRVGDEERARCFAMQARALKGNLDTSIRLVRVLFAVGRLRQAAVMLLEIFSDPASQKSQEALLLGAMKTFEEGRYQASVDMASRSLLVQPQDPADAYEALLLRDLSSAALGVPPKNDDDQEAVDERLRQSEDSGAGRTLYWPPALREALSNALIKLNLRKP